MAISFRSIEENISMEDSPALQALESTVDGLLKRFSQGPSLWLPSRIFSHVDNENLTKLIGRYESVGWKIKYCKTNLGDTYIFSPKGEPK